MARRLALFLPSMDDGGAQVVFAHLAAEWAARGQPVDVVVARGGGETLHRLDRRVRLIDLRCHRTATAVLSLARYLRTEQPSLLMSAIEHANIVAWMARGLARTRVRLVCSAHNHVSHLIRPASGRRHALGWLLARAYRGSDGVVAVSSAVADDVTWSAELPRGKVQVILNPMDVQRVRELAQIESVEVPGRPWFLGVGRLEPVKDFHTLIRAFARVHAQRGGHLTLLGQGSQQASLLRLVDELDLVGAVHVPGYRPNPYPWMAHADAVVGSSIREGFGMVLAEALALGTQVVSTRAGGGPEEVLQFGACGHLAETGSVHSLEFSMLNALDMPIPRDRLLQRAESFDVSEVASSYLEYFERPV